MWFWIWCVLVLGAGVGGFFLGRDLWRRAKATLHAGAGLGEALDAMSQKVTALEAQQPASIPRPVDVFADRRDLAELVADRRRLRRERAHARRLGHAARYERWRMIDR